VPNPWFDGTGPTGGTGPPEDVADGHAGPQPAELATMIGLVRADDTNVNYADAALAESQQQGLATAIALARADSAAALAPGRPMLHRPGRPAPTSPRPGGPGPPGERAGRATVRPRAAGPEPAGPEPARPAPERTEFRAVGPAAAAEGPVPALTRVRRTANRLSRRFGYVQTPLLMAILTFQAVQSLRLVWSNTAFLDEATYLSAGHVMIAHWLHGTPAPAYSTFFSGAPVLYPPLAAMAASVGGLAAARILSLVFMLGTTALLWGTAATIFGSAAGVCAATLFAVTGATLRLGAFATYDAMALFLLAASAWCVASSRDRDDSAFRLIAGVVLLALANATKYSTMIFDPSVIAIAGLTVARRDGFKPGIARSGYIAAGVIGLLSALLTIGGPSYVTGVLVTTIARQRGADPASLVLADAWKWVGLICVAAAAGLVLCLIRRDGRVQAMILAVLVLSGVLAPLNQARINTTISLSKHVDFGAWFAAAAAGYAVSKLAQVGRRTSVRLAVVVIALLAVAAPAAIVGRAQAWTMFQGWPNSADVVTELRVLAAKHPGHYLAEDYDVPTYYLENTTTWQQWSGTWYFSYVPPGSKRALTGPAAYRAAIGNHYFALVVLDFEATPQTDQLIAADMHQAGGYKVISVVPSSLGQYTIWAYQAPPQSAGQSGDS
jgi:hypothetical protein